MRKGLIVIGIYLSMFGCDQPNDSNGKLKVITTTGMLYDAVINIGGDSIEAEALMGPGVDPHLYKATQGDLNKLNNADIIIYNGLLLEGKMGEILEKLGRLKPVYAAAESIPEEKLLGSVQYENAPDPHIWFDVLLWKQAVMEISQVLQKEDSLNAAFYQANTKRYLNTLDTLHNYAKKRIAEIPERQRILVTAHDAFRYFGQAYDIRVEGIQGISTVSDFGLRDISDITEMIIQNGVKAIFVETSVSDRAVKAVVVGCREKGHEIVIGGSLYSDAMGSFGTFEGTYVGMVTKNIDTITESLK